MRFENAVLTEFLREVVINLLFMVHLPKPAWLHFLNEKIKVSVGKEVSGQKYALLVVISVSSDVSRGYQQRFGSQSAR